MRRRAHLQDDQEEHKGEDGADVARAGGVVDGAEEARVDRGEDAGAQPVEGLAWGQRREVGLVGGGDERW